MNRRTRGQGALSRARLADREIIGGIVSERQQLREFGRHNPAQEQKHEQREKQSTEEGPVPKHYMDINCERLNPTFMS
jgi:hypothetical protein